MIPIQQPALGRASDAYQLTRHARIKSDSRRLSANAIAAALRYGRVVHARGAAIYAIGRKEVRHLREYGIDLSQFEGVQVVCSKDGAILTVYRNRDFRRLHPN